MPTPSTKRPRRTWQTLAACKETKCPWRGRALPRLEELESRLTPAALAAPVTLDTTPSWNGSSSIGAFGQGSTATYGETFVAPANVLQDFSFHLEGNSGVHLSMRAYVFAWSGSLFGGGGGQATGPALYGSPSAIHFDGNGGFQTVDVVTGGVPLTPGGHYVMLLTISNPGDAGQSTGTTAWGIVPNHVPAEDGGGGFVFYNNNAFNLLNTTTWDNFSDFGSLAFTAHFGPSVATAPSVTAQPADATATAGAAASFTAAASGSPAPLVQWYAEAPDAGGFSAISDDGNLYGGTTTDTLTVNAAADLTGYRFEAVFSNAGGQVTTDAATLTVASQVAYAAPALAVAAGADTGAFTFQLEDQTGDPVALAGEVIQLQTSDQTGRFLVGGSPATFVTTDAHGSASFVYTDTAAGTPTLTLADANLNFSASPQVTVTAGRATQIALTSPALSIIAGQDTGTFTVQAEDQFGNPVADPGEVIRLQSSDPSGLFEAAGSALNGSATTGADGSASFVYTTRVAGVDALTLADADLGFSAAPQVTVVPGPADHLIFLRQPTGATAGLAISPGVRVEVVDPYGNPVTSADGSTVTVSVASGPLGAGNNPAGFDPGAVVTAPVVHGVAEFDGLILDAAGSYTLAAADKLPGLRITGPQRPILDGPGSASADALTVLSGPTLTSLPSDPFTVVAGPADKIGFVQRPTDTPLGRAINPDVEVRVEDAHDNPIAGDAVTLTADGPDGARQVFTAVSDADGLADFAGVVLNAVGAYTVTASDAPASSGPSPVFQVSPLGPTQLVFLQQPGNVVSGQPTDVQVKAVVPAGPVAAGTITLSVVSGPAGFDPADVISVPVGADGVADFGRLIFDAAGGYVLGASYAPSAGGAALAGPFSAAFTVFPAGVTLTPTRATAPVGATFGLTGAFAEQGEGPAGGTVVRVGWGDGSSETDAVAVGKGQGVFNASHIYQNQGVYSVTVLVLDAGGNVVGVGALPAPVEVLPAGTGAVNTTVAPPGATVTHSAADAISGTITTTTLTVAPGDAGGELLTADVMNFVPPPTPGLLQTVASFEIRQENLQQGDSALITFVVPAASLASGTVPKLYFLDPTTGKETQFVGVSNIAPAGDALVITIRLDNNSTPKLTQLTGTVFTVAASTPGAAVVTAVSPAVASAATGQAAVQAASFQSTSTLTLPLAASETGQTNTSRSSLAADGGGDDTPMSDADADGLVHYLFEKLDLLPKIRLPRTFGDAIRAWLHQVGLTTPDAPAAERLAALDSVFSEPPPARAGAVAAPAVVRPPAGRPAPEAPAGRKASSWWALPLAGVGVALKAKKKRGRDAGAGGGRQPPV